MNFQISVEHSRHEMEEYNTETIFDKCIFGTDKYGFTGNIHLHNTEDQIIGIIEVLFLDEDLTSDKNAGSLAEVADSIDEDIAGAFQYLEQSKIFDQSLPLMLRHSCYISTFYIDPKYRCQGLGTYLLKNFNRICRHMFNIPLNYIIVYPKPDLTEDEEKKRMCNFFEKNGFVPLKNSGYYAKLSE